MIKNEKDFIEKAIEGGWENTLSGDMRFMERSENVGIFLDPKAWQAVGKVEGWDGCPPHTHTDDCGFGKCDHKSGHRQMHHFIDHLIAGKTIKEALQAL